MFDFFAIVILIEYSTLLNKTSGGVFFRYGERPRSLNALVCFFVSYFVVVVRAISCFVGFFRLLHSSET